MSTYSHTDLWDDEVSSRFCPFNDRLAAVDDPQARLERRRLFRHIIVSPLRTGVGWIVHEPSAVTKLRLLHDHPAAPIKRDGELVRRRTHKQSKRLGVFCVQPWSRSRHC